MKVCALNRNLNLGLLMAALLIQFQMVFANEVNALIGGEYVRNGNGSILVPRCAKDLSHLGESTFVYDVASVEEKLNRNPKSIALKNLYEKMKRLGGDRAVALPPDAEAFERLRQHSPNHRQVIDELALMAALHRAAGEPMMFTPILLLGPPGIGKTHFAYSLAKIIGTKFQKIPMASTTAGWLLSGASSQYDKSEGPGKVAQPLIDGLTANPLLLVDEGDKASIKANHDPLGPLYDLLEKDTARAFIDEFVEVEMDASHVLWIMTANDESLIPDPILDRMDVYEINKPTHEEAMTIALIMYKGFLFEHPKWNFVPEPSHDVLDKLAKASPRGMGKILKIAFGTAHAANNRDHLIPDDIDLSKGSRDSGPKIGFTN